MLSQGTQITQDGKVRAVESRILIVMTGGTICMRPTDAGLAPSGSFLDNAMATRPSFNDGSEAHDIEVVVDKNNSKSLCKSLRTPMSVHEKQIRYCVYEFENLLDSSSIESEGWTQIAEVVFQNYQLFDGFVILHGTDSLAYTSSALSFMLQDLGKPVVLTGSQASMFQLQNDATDNLLGSMIIAGHFMIPEVCLFFNYKLFRGNRATKVSATDFDAFASPNHAPLATISSAGTRVLWHLVKRPDDIKPLSLASRLDTASVACLRMFPGIKPEMLDAVLQVSGLRGLILETFGAGNAPSGPDGAVTNVLAKAVQRGIVIVNITQCLSGNVSRAYAPGTALAKAGVVLGGDMTTEAALTKLAYLLSEPETTPDIVANRMAVSLRGEVTVTMATSFEHPEETPERNTTKFNALGHAITEGDMEKVNRMVSQEDGWLLNEADYLGNTALHIAVMCPSIEIVNLLLSKGALVHVRNKAGNTPLFVAANAGRRQVCMDLRDAGAHLHPQEEDFARHLHSRGHSELWLLACARAQAD